MRTDENPPLAKFPADFGILEARAARRRKPLLPVTVRNVEAGRRRARCADLARSASDAAAAPLPGQVARVAPGDEMQIVDWLRRIEQANRIEREYDEKTDKWIVKMRRPRESIFTPKRSRDDDRGAEARRSARRSRSIGIPLTEPGFYVVELASPRLGAALFGEPKPYYVRTATLVTNLGVHFKLGRESSLVWVTRLADGKPVANAQVDVRDCAGTRRTGKAAPTRPASRASTSALPDATHVAALQRRRAARAYFVTARTGDDMAFAFSDWGEGIAPWRFNVPTGNCAAPTSPTRCSTARSSARARRCR